ncbi:hypothetical protein HanRHA438_Chr10g0453801 [Helianthus annuus]|nr:hypothetical protein HanRHA438_Chr10g0453801 [Helianthus annuus]
MVNPNITTYQICNGESTCISPPPHLSHPHLNCCPNPHTFATNFFGGNNQPFSRCGDEGCTAILVTWALDVERSVGCLMVVEGGGGGRGWRRLVVVAGGDDIGGG